MLLGYKEWERIEWRWRGWVEKARLVAYETYENEGEGKLGAGRTKGLINISLTLV